MWCHPNPTHSSGWWAKRWTCSLVKSPACPNDCVVVGTSLKARWVRPLGSKVLRNWSESLGCQQSPFAVRIGWVLHYSSSSISCVDSGVSTYGGWWPRRSLRFARVHWGEQRQASSWSGWLDCWDRSPNGLSGGWTSSGERGAYSCPRTSAGNRSFGWTPSKWATLHPLLHMRNEYSLF